MKKAQKFSKSIYAVLTIVVIIAFQAQILKAEGADPAEEAKEKREILWLARVIYSESKKSNEQVLLAWVARNRVETSFRGETYEEVAKSPAQFSGLQMSDKQYKHNLSRDYQSEGDAWQNALSIARAVYYADGSLRPFPITVRHFYSPRSAGFDPHWTGELTPVLLIKDGQKESVRFAFYDSVK